jgi:hypothetical protein
MAAGDGSMLNNGDFFGQKYTNGQGTMRPAFQPDPHGPAGFAPAYGAPDGQSASPWDQQQNSSVDMLSDVERLSALQKLIRDLQVSDFPSGSGLGGPGANPQGSRLDPQFANMQVRSGFHQSEEPFQEVRTRTCDSLASIVSDMSDTLPGARGPSGMAGSAEDNNRDGWGGFSAAGARQMGNRGPLSAAAAQQAARHLPDVSPFADCYSGGGTGNPNLRWDDGQFAPSPWAPAPAAPFEDLAAGSFENLNFTVKNTFLDFEQRELHPELRAWKARTYDGLPQLNGRRED